MLTFPLRIPAILVRQPLADFYVVSLPARTVRQITYLDPTRIEKVDRNRLLYSLLGAQRMASPTRARKIAKYIDTVEAAFPNSVILSANYINDGVLQEDETKRWRVEKTPSGGFELVIPTADQMASVIDGQHRLLGFDFCEEKRKDMELICSVYVDLPHSYQAYLFATININQRKVDKSLAYEQFGYNLDEEKAVEWSPDKLAVFLTRKLNLKKNSPFAGHIKIAPIDDTGLLQANGSWRVSTAAIVEGIMRLISRNPKKDREDLHSHSILSRNRALLPNDGAPWRRSYLNVEDDLIFDGIETYFQSAKEHLFSRAASSSYINKTIGIQALFDLLISFGALDSVDELKFRSDKIFSKVALVDFSHPFYQASGKGRVRVKNTLFFIAGIIDEMALPESDRLGYLEIRRTFVDAG